MKAKLFTLILIIAAFFCGVAWNSRASLLSPTFNSGSATFVHTIAPGASVAQLVTVDGADNGACIPSFSPALEDTKISATAHVDSYGLVMVVVKNESSDSYNFDCTLRVLNIEY